MTARCDSPGVVSVVDFIEAFYIHLSTKIVSMAIQHSQNGKAISKGGVAIQCSQNKKAISMNLRVE